MFFILGVLISLAFQAIFAALKMLLVDPFVALADYGRSIRLMLSERPVFIFAPVVQLRHLFGFAVMMLAVWAYVQRHGATAHTQHVLTNRLIAGLAVLAILWVSPLVVAIAHSLRWGAITSQALALASRPVVFSWALAPATFLTIMVPALRKLAFHYDPWLARHALIGPMPHGVIGVATVAIAIATLAIGAAAFALRKVEGVAVASIFEKGTIYKKGSLDEQMAGIVKDLGVTFPVKVN
jgi:hypothetical protein